tara:strand:+ start:1041 stop:1829 length:789 start_codon:yes stop_codon:yes gene_type:complete
MKITLFTSNKARHNYFANLLSEIADELYVIQECNTIFPGKLRGQYQISDQMAKYFEKVNSAQDKFFPYNYIRNLNRNIKLLPLGFGDLNQSPLKLISDFLKSDIYIVFGSSWIKGDLLKFLTDKGAINIHMGVSPYYRGTDCNFWALYDNNPHLVGATVHLLSSGLDNGPILYHAMSNLKTNPYEYTMSCVKSAFHSLYERIKSGSIFKLDSVSNIKEKQIRYSKKIDFNDLILKKYFNKEINLNSKSFDKELLKDPYFFNN